jgi:hypothetical protein
MTPSGWRRLAAALLLTVAVPAQARPPVYGWVERVDLGVDGQRVRVKAKLDSGARSSSLHATDITPFERGGRRLVRFSVPGGPDGAAITLERPVTRIVRIKRHSGPYDRRPVVTLPVCLGSAWHEVEVSLTDRSRFIYPLLLGRRALAGHALVDPEHTHLRPADCAAPGAA